MEKAMKVLKESPIVYMGTINKNGTPDVRPFNFMFEREGKPYFCTNSTMGAYADMQNNPNIAISVMTPQYQWIRLYAKVVFTDDIEIKQAMIDSNETVKKLFATADNSDLKAFYLSEGEVTYYDYSGNPPEKSYF